MTEPATTILPRPQSRGFRVGGRSDLNRRSVKECSRKPILLKQLSQILWAAQGITDKEGGRRAAPSPLRAILAWRHACQVRRPDLVFADCVRKPGAGRPGGRAAAIIAVTSVFARAVVKYGERGVQYSLQESGCVAENIHIQTAALGLGTVMVGAFDELEVGRLIGVGKDEKPLLLMPIGALS